MKQLFLLLSLIALAGCGSSAAPVQGDGADKSSKPVRTVKRPTKRPKPPWPPKFTVEAADYAGIPEAIDALVSGDADARIRATGWLARQGSDAVAPLAARLNKGEGTGPDIAICYVLGCIDDSAVPPLIDVLKNSDDKRVRINAAKYLGLVPTKQAAVIEQKVKALIDVMRNHSDESTRVAAINALTQIGPPAKQWAQAPLQAILDDRGQNNAIRGAAGKAIKSVAPRTTLVEN